MMFISGVRWQYVLPTLLLGATALTILILNWPNRLRRFVSFIDPWQNRGDEAYQLFEGMMGFGVGGLTGKGAASGALAREGRLDGRVEVMKGLRTRRRPASG